MVLYRTDQNPFPNSDPIDDPLYKITSASDIRIYCSYFVATLDCLSEKLRKQLIAFFMLIIIIF